MPHKEMDFEFDMEELDWPTQSPDLWYELDQQVRARPYRLTLVLNFTNAVVGECEEISVASKAFWEEWTLL